MWVKICHTCHTWSESHWVTSRLPISCCRAAGFQPGSFLIQAPPHDSIHQFFLHPFFCMHNLTTLGTTQFEHIWTLWCFAASNLEPVSDGIPDGTFRLSSIMWAHLTMCVFPWVCKWTWRPFRSRRWRLKRTDPLRYSTPARLPTNILSERSCTHPTHISVRLWGRDTLCRCRTCPRDVDDLNPLASMGYGSHAFVAYNFSIQFLCPTSHHFLVIWAGIT